MKAKITRFASRFRYYPIFRGAPLLAVLLVVATGHGNARSGYGSAFFTAYPSAVGTALDNLPSNSGHCGVCHLDFNGRGPKNPYGIALEDHLDNGMSIAQAINALDTEDPDGDGFITATEMDVTGPYGNTPTFPGLKPGEPYLSNLKNIPLSEVLPYLIPTITVIPFAGLESATAGIESAILTWSAATSSCPPVTYSIYQSTTSGGQDFGTPVTTTTSLSTGVPLDPGTSSLQTYYFVVRATEGCGGSETNTVELSAQPLLDPGQDQDGDGMSNGFEEPYALDPFNPADATSDPDGDGLTTFEEAAYGSTNPNDPASVNRPSPIEVDDAGTIYLALSYVPSKGLTTASIAAEATSDLFTWDSGPTYTTIVSVADNGDATETVVERMNTPMSSSRLGFMRLGVAPAQP